MAGGFAQAHQQLEMIVRSHPNENFVVAKKLVYEGLSQTYRQLRDTEQADYYQDLAKKA